MRTISGRKLLRSIRHVAHHDQRDSRILLDRNIDLDQVEALHQAISQEDTDQVTDLHVWQINPGQTAAVVRIDATTPESPAHYKKRLQHIAALDHITVEVNHRPSGSREACV